MGAASFIAILPRRRYRRGDGVPLHAVKATRGRGDSVPVTSTPAPRRRGAGDAKTPSTRRRSPVDAPAGARTSGPGTATPASPRTKRSKSAACPSRRVPRGPRSSSALQGLVVWALNAATAASNGGRAAASTCGTAATRGASGYLLVAISRLVLLLESMWARSCARGTTRGSDASGRRSTGTSWLLIKRKSSTRRGEAA